MENNNKTIMRTDYVLNWSLRAIMVWEKLTNETFNLNNLSSQLTFLYCVIIINNETNIKYDEFIDQLDDNPEYQAELLNWLRDEVISRNK